MNKISNIQASVGIFFFHGERKNFTDKIEMRLIASSKLIIIPHKKYPGQKIINFGMRFSILDYR